MIRLIILDFDGTLGDTRANIVLTMRQTLEALGYPVASEEAIAATIGLPLEESFRVLLPGLAPEEMAVCARTYREIFEKNRKWLVPALFPHVKETLSALSADGLKNDWLRALEKSSSEMLAIPKSKPASA